jgi:hypothetical protein
MRKITSQASAAFTNARNFRNGSTEVSTSGDNVYLWLHNHNIARNGPDNGLEINLCGWNTPTTRDRLSGLPGVYVSTRKGQAYLNGNPIPSDGWVKISG